MGLTACDKTSWLGIKFCTEKQNTATHGWWGGICVHVYAQTHTALRQCKPSDIAADPVGLAHSNLQNTKTDSHILKDKNVHSHAEKWNSCSYSCIFVCTMYVSCALFYKKPLVWGSWLTPLITETSNHKSYTQNWWVSAVSFIKQWYLPCTPTSIEHSSTAFCSFTFQWRQPTTMSGIVKVTSAHTCYSKCHKNYVHVCNMRMETYWRHT